MPVYPIQWQPLVKTGYYPHMAPRDLLIWERFLDAFSGEFAAVAYDLALGGFILDPSIGTEADRLGYQYSTALKIDATLQRQDEVWIVEVKPAGHTSALGAALAYTILAERDGFSPFPLVPVVVTDRMSPDVKYAADALGVLVVEVPDTAGAGPAPSVALPGRGTTTPPGPRTP